LDQSNHVPSRPVIVAALVIAGVFRAVGSTSTLGAALTAPIATLPALWVLTRLGGWRGFIAGGFMGICSCAVGLHWIPTTVLAFSNLGPVLSGLVWLLAAIIVGSPIAIFGWGARAAREAGGQLWPISVAAWFAAAEHLAPQLIPVLQGIALSQQPRLFLSSGLFGIAGVSFLIVLLNGCILLALERRAAQQPILGGGLQKNAAVWLVSTAIALGYAQYRLSVIEEAEQASTPMTVGIVQANYDFAQLRALDARDPRAVTQLHVDKTKLALERGEKIDVFVWPEGAARTGIEAGDDVTALARSSGAELWVGGYTWHKRPGQKSLPTNSGFRVSNEGVVEARYDKSVLLPFGEFMPFEGIFPFLSKIQGPGRFHPGTGPAAMDTPFGPIGFLICYEAIVRTYTRALAALGPRLFVTVSYDAWFGDSLNPRQHLALAAAQSALHGVPQIRSAATGISGVIDARGVVTARTPLFEEAVLVREVRPLRAPTLYSAIGDWFAFLCVLFSCWFVLRTGWMREREEKRSFVARIAVALTVAAVPLTWQETQAAPLLDVACQLLFVVAVIGPVVVSRFREG